MARRKPSSAGVIDLADARDDRRLRNRQLRLEQVLESNRGALGRLFQSGAIFSRAGARLGRDLLLAHQHLLKASDLLVRLERLGPTEPDGSDADTGALDAELEALMARTRELSERSDVLVGREP